MTRKEVRAFDAWAINTLGLPGVALMENAGRSCAELIKEKLAGIARPKACVFCGTGNNGGDGYVIARHLANDGVKVQVIICGLREKIKGDAKINLDIIEKMGLYIEQLDVADDRLSAKITEFAKDCDILVDGLFGTGLKGELNNKYASLIKFINQQDISIIAVDIPSGLDCDTGQPLGTAIRAIATVTFVAMKKGFTFDGAANYTGRVFVASIGIEPEIRKTLSD
jgi:NAD(P)H-hydrate epimerase